MSSNPARRMRRQHPKEWTMRGNGLMFPQAPQPQQVGVQVAQPMNDTQLVALVAAQIAGRYDHLATNAVVAERAVDLAVEIVARSFAKVAGGHFQARLQAAARPPEADPAA